MKYKQGDILEHKGSMITLVVIETFSQSYIVGNAVAPSTLSNPFIQTDEGLDKLQYSLKKKDIPPAKTVVMVKQFKSDAWRYRLATGELDGDSIFCLNEGNHDTAPTLWEYWKLYKS